jgi:predicted nucleic acid-binding protein
MPVIICDTGPLVALSSLGLLEILSRLYTPVVTRAVLDEWGARDDRPDLSSAFEIIDVAPPDPLLAVQLDPGEASVIQAAMERSCKRVLLDERKARKVARRVFGLETIGTAGVLVQARRHSTRMPHSTFYILHSPLSSSPSEANPARLRVSANGRHPLPSAQIRANQWLAFPFVPSVSP